MATKTRAAIVGLGWAGREHLQSYLEHPDAEVVAVCDMDADRCAKAVADFGPFDVEHDYKRLMKRDDVDVVSIGLPNFLHCPVAVAALNAGKHVMCEKPPALNATEAKKMAAAAKRSKRFIMFAMVQRFRAESRYVRDMVDRGDMGEVYFGRTAYVRRSGTPVGAGGWFVDKKRSGGGALIDIGVHCLDRAWFMMGCPKPASVSGAAYLKFAHRVPKGVPMDVDDATFALIKFATGATLIVQATWALNQPNEHGTWIAGTRAGIKLDPLTVFAEQNGTLVDIQPQVPEAKAFRAEVAHFVDSVRARKQPQPGAQQGVQLMQMLDAIYKSSRTGKEVRIGT